MYPRRAIACALTLAFAAVLMQCAHRQPGTGEQPPPLPSPPTARTAQTPVFRDCANCPEMVEIPGGTFRMGLADWWTNNSTKPSHPVTVRPFAIGLREVTRDEYAVFAEATDRTTPSCTPRPEDNNAARCLTWYDAEAYAEWLSFRTGQLYRLPSESEWEYVARGSDLDGVSRFGVQDLFTDVREWMADCHYPNYVGAPADGTPWVENPACLPRVVRGRNGLDSGGISSSGRHRIEGSASTSSGTPPHAGGTWPTLRRPPPACGSPGPSWTLLICDRFRLDEPRPDRRSSICRLPGDCGRVSSPRSRNPACRFPRRRPKSTDQIPCRVEGGA